MFYWIAKHFGLFLFDGFHNAGSLEKGLLAARCHTGEIFLAPLICSLISRGGIDARPSRQSQGYST